MKNKLLWQVIDYKISKKLAILGVKQESLFYWCHNTKWPNDAEEWVLYSINDWNGTKKGLGFKELYSAFTVAELGKILIAGFGTSKMMNGLWSYGSDDNHYSDLGEEKTEANARAKLLIYLIENKLIKI